MEKIGLKKKQFMQYPRFIKRAKFYEMRLKQKRTKIWGYGCYKNYEGK